MALQHVIVTTVTFVTRSTPRHASRRGQRCICVRSRPVLIDRVALCLSSCVAPSSSQIHCTDNQRLPSLRNFAYHRQQPHNPTSHPIPPFNRSLATKLRRHAAPSLFSGHPPVPPKKKKNVPTRASGRRAAPRIAVRRASKTAAGILGGAVRRARVGTRVHGGRQRRQRRRAQRQSGRDATCTCTFAFIPSSHTAPNRRCGVFFASFFFFFWFANRALVLGDCACVRIARD